MTDNLTKGLQEDVRSLRIAYLIPEWPGQTHIWMWREICALRGLGATVIVYSTRPPQERDRARHAFAEQASKETRYLWPRSKWCFAADVASTCISHPLATGHAITELFKLPVEKKRGFRTAVPVGLLAAEMAAMMKRDKIDHVHVASVANCALIAMASKIIAGFPFSLTVNANVEWWGGAMKQKFASANIVVSIADWLCGAIIRVAPELSKGKILYAPVGVDTSVWKPVSRNWPSKDEPLKIVSVGRLVLSKGHDTLIEAVSELRKQGHLTMLKILGAGPDRARLESLIQTLNLHDSVELTGSVSEDAVRDEIETSHVFALASHAEPLGVVYMEAMATGIPAIGTNAGGVGEIIVNGVTGFLIPPKDPNALAEKIAYIHEHPDDALRIGMAGRASIEQKFDSRKCAKLLYDAILKSIVFSHAARETCSPT